MPGPVNALFTRTSLAAGAAAVLLFASAQLARAEELPGLNAGPPDVVDQASPTPAPANTPNPNTAPAVSPPVNTNAAPAPPGRSSDRPGARRTGGTAGEGRRFEHWEVAPTLMWTFSTGSDIVPPGHGESSIGKPAGNTLPLDVLRIIGDVRYRFNRRYGLFYQRIAHTGATGRTAPVPISKKNPLGGTYGGHSEDYEERFLLTDQIDPYLAARAGYAIRTRQCCPASGALGNKAPRIHTGFFSDIAWRFGPNTIGGKPWSTSFRWEEYRHRTTIPVPVNDEGVKPTFSFTLYSNFYVYHQTKLVPYYGIEYFSTYFSYSPQMSETYRKVYGMSYRATRDVTWRAYVKNDQSGGVLASSGDSAHKSTLFLEGTYRLHW
ncbi:MAG TPA: hypothetical protein VHS78_11760 [Candidatus Elarobacter sp.]|jgi:hypothetical protein|nr:hypothetical protein [Candidatus Elarobacter sp.]